MPTQITLITRNGKTVKREGTSGLIMTATREGEDLEVQMDFDIPTAEEAVTMISALLTQLEQLHGEQFIMLCLAHYSMNSPIPSSHFRVGLL